MMVINGSNTPRQAAQRRAGTLIQHGNDRLIWCPRILNAYTSMYMHTIDRHERCQGGKIAERKTAAQRQQSPVQVIQTCSSMFFLSDFAARTPFLTLGMAVGTASLAAPTPRSRAKLMRLMTASPACGPATNVKSGDVNGLPLLPSIMSGSAACPVVASTSNTLSPSGAKCLLPQVVRSIRMGRKSRPRSVSKYSWRGGRWLYWRRSSRPDSTSELSRRVSMLGAMSRLFWNWSKRVSPWNASRRMRMLHHSPTRSSVRAIGHCMLPKLFRSIDNFQLADYH